MTEQQTVIVTGAGTGIGRATALRFARAGFSVIANGRRLPPLETTLALSSGMPGRVIPVTGDAGTEATAAALVARAVAEGGFCCLVNNAGVGWSYGVDHPGTMAALADTTPDQWHEVLRINLDSVYLLCREALRHFREQGGGSIVNVSSAGGTRGMDDAHTYATAKAGVINLTRSLARAYGREGIRSNVIAPGFVATDMVTPVLESDLNPFADEELRFQASPLGRPGRPEEIADAIYYMGVEATYCNGAVLVIDGGSTA
ncbi:MAG: SDR family oxidoreductase [Pseudomonadales bacterium]